MVRWEEEMIRMYDAVAEKAGIYEYREDGAPIVLLPCRHIFINATIEITLAQDGTCISAALIENKKDQKTITGATDESLARGSNYAPHMLCDTLAYVAADAPEYLAADKKQAEAAKKKHEAYLSQLNQMLCFAEGRTQYQEACIVMHAVSYYTRHGALVHDLLSCGIPDIDKVLMNKDMVNTSLFVRFRIQGTSTEECWKNRHLHRFWQEFLLAQELTCKTARSIYTGKTQAIGTKIPGQLLPGDQSRLISSMQRGVWDMKSRGRFEDTMSETRVTRDDLSKIYCMIKYLIDGYYRNLNGYFVTVWDCKHFQPETRWEVATSELTAPKEQKEDHYQEIDLTSFLEGKGIVGSGELEWKDGLATGELNHKAQGNRNKLAQPSQGGLTAWQPDGDVMYLAMRKSSPKERKGRISVVDFFTLSNAEYEQRLKKWHTEGAWYMTKWQDGKPEPTCGVPGIWRMATLLYGKENKLTGYMELKRDNTDYRTNRFCQGMTMALLKEYSIPYPYVEDAVSRASKPFVFKRRYNYDAVLSVACTLLSKYYKYGNMKEFKKDMENNRSYLFGQMWAVLYMIEYSTFTNEDKKNNKMTNADKWMEQFRKQPAKIWTEVYNRVSAAYLSKLSFASRSFFQRQIDELLYQMAPDDFNNQTLEDVYLCGLGKKRCELMHPKEKK